MSNSGLNSLIAAFNNSDKESMVLAVKDGGRIILRGVLLSNRRYYELIIEDIRETQSTNQCYKFDVDDEFRFKVHSQIRLPKITLSENHLIIKGLKKGASLFTSRVPILPLDNHDCSSLLSDLLFRDDAAPEQICNIDAWSLYFMRFLGMQYLLPPNLSPHLVISASDRIIAYKAESKEQVLSFFRIGKQISESDIISVSDWMENKSNVFVLSLYDLFAVPDVIQFSVGDIYFYRKDDNELLYIMHFDNAAVVSTVAPKDASDLYFIKEDTALEKPSVIK